MGTFSSSQSTCFLNTILSATLFVFGFSGSQYFSIPESIHPSQGVRDKTLGVLEPKDAPLWFDCSYFYPLEILTLVVNHPSWGAQDGFPGSMIPCREHPFVLMDLLAVP